MQRRIFGWKTSSSLDLGADETAREKTCRPRDFLSDDEEPENIVDATQTSQNLVKCFSSGSSYSRNKITFHTKPGLACREPAFLLAGSLSSPSSSRTFESCWRSF